MTRLCLALCLAVLPVAAFAEGSEEKVELPELAVDALTDKTGGRIRGIELAKPSSGATGASMCATSNAYNSNGNFIGLTYWELGFNADGTEVKSVRNVTGLNSDCYSDRYKPYGR